MNTYTSKNADLVVVGGGLSGICAAIAAARCGLKVILCHNRPMLGGNSSSEIRVWACGATGMGNNRYADETGIINELILTNLHRNPEGNPYLWDNLLLETVFQETNIELMLNTYAHTTNVISNRLQSVLCYQITTGHDFQLNAPLFIDCTGDAVIASKAGAACIHGVSNKPSSRANKGSLGSSLFFSTKRCDNKVRYIPPYFAIPKEEISRLLSSTDKTLTASHDGCDLWWIEYGGEHDTIGDSEVIAFKLRQIVFGVWDYIKNSGDFDADFLTLDWVGSLPGRRESLRVISEHMLTDTEISNQVLQPDAVCHGGWPIDTHPLSGFFGRQAACTQLPIGVYDIPLRALICRDIHNLLLAGRNAGMMHEAMASARVMKTCAVMGQAAGTAAAHSIKQGVLPRDLKNEHLTELCQQLIRNDVWIIGLQNEDLLDLARNAIIDGTRGILLDCPPEDTLLLEEPCHIILPPLLHGGEISIPIKSANSVTFSLFSSNAPQNYLPIQQLKKELFHSLARLSDCSIFVPPNENNLILRIESVEAYYIGTRHLPIPGVLGIRGESATGLRGIFMPAIHVSPDPNLFPPSQVINGFSRPFKGMNCWVARFDKGAELRITLNHPSAIHSVELYLDCGLYRDYNNLRPNYYNDEWANPHMNLLRDFSLDLIYTNDIRSMDIKDNHQRHIKVEVQPFDLIRAVHIRCQRSWGGEVAVVFEVRLYG